MLRRRLLAVLNWLGTGVLVVLLSTSGRSFWYEVGALVWWVAVIAHGWFLARRGRKQTRRRVTAVAVTLPVLLVVVFLRVDASRIGQDVADARAQGDCARAVAALDRRWFGNRLADAPLAFLGDDTVAACRLLAEADYVLDQALEGDLADLQTGFRHLSSVRTGLPGHEEMVQTTLDAFLEGLPTPDSCETKDITYYLGGRPATVVPRAARDIVPKVEPGAIVRCADRHMATLDWTGARTLYQQLLDRYPNHELAARATEGITRATQEIELANVRGLLQSSAYCDRPAPYSGAAPYGPGPNRAVVVGAAEYVDRLPVEWKAGDAAEAVAVVCAGATEFGAPVETCRYRGEEPPFAISAVTYRKILVPVRVYELRTARLVVETRVEMGGASCPDLVFGSPTGLPPDMHVSPSDGDVHAGFRPLFIP
jgi:hypothetical protein